MQFEFGGCGGGNFVAANIRDFFELNGFGPPKPMTVSAIAKTSASITDLPLSPSSLMRLKISLNCSSVGVEAHVGEVVFDGVGAAVFAGCEAAFASDEFGRDGFIG